MSVQAFGRAAVRTVRRTGPRPLIIGRLVAHRAERQWHRRRLRGSYAKFVTNAPPSRLRLPPIALEAEAHWPTELQDALAELRSEGDAALAHRVNLLGSGPVALGEDIDWHRDFKSGFRWPRAFYQDVVVTRLDDDSDAKVPWELSRGHQLLALARAAAVFGDPEAATELERQLRSWIIANEPGFGINWTTPMEVSIRAINWVWAIAAIESWRPLGEPLRSLVERSLAAHGRHIWHNLEGSPHLRGNHYLADIVGLLVLGWALPEDPLSQRWLRYARRSLEHEARIQVLPDGVSFEASLGYHGLVLEMLLLARWVSGLTNRPLSAGFDHRLRQMLDASLSLRHPSGRIPQFGDSDSGRVLPASSLRPPTHDHLLWTGAAILGTPVPPGTAAHEEVAFNFGLHAWRGAAAQASPAAGAAAPARSFPAAGLHVLRGRRSHLVVRCGDVGQNGNGGHSHNDLLSFELSVAGQLVVADPGTYAYTSNIRARNQFRGTAVHSTVMVQDEEINPIDPDEPFRLARWARIIPHQLAVSAAELRLVCAHDGYRRLHPPTIVRRTFALALARDELSVTDEVDPGGPYGVRSALQLAPGWSVRASGQDRFELRCDDAQLTLFVFGHAGVSIGNGRVAPEFGVMECAPRLEIVAAGGGAVRFGCRIACATAAIS